MFAIALSVGGRLVFAITRVVFALVALSLVVPAALAPSIAAAWAAGVGPARRRVGEVLGGLWTVSLPAAAVQFNVFTNAATYVPVAPRLTRIAFAASFTSESKPHPAIAT